MHWRAFVYPNSEGSNVLLHGPIAIVMLEKRFAGLLRVQKGDIFPNFGSLKGCETFSDLSSSSLAEGLEVICFHLKILM